MGRGVTMRASDRLRALFEELVRNAFLRELRYHEPGVISYVSALLADFTRTDQLYKIKNVSGRRLDDVGEMLIESNPLLEARSFIREREVRKHIGDYTLFFTGLFPEHLKLPRQTLRLDYFVDYMKAGKESYHIVSKFDQFEFRRVAPLFRRLADDFELLAYGLNRVRDEMRRMESGYYQQLERTVTRSPSDHGCK
jgi:hypothetical protein